MSKRNKGFTLIEVIVTVAIASIVASGSMILLTTSLNQNKNIVSNSSSRSDVQIAFNRLTKTIMQSEDYTEVSLGNDKLVRILYNSYDTTSGSSTISYEERVAYYMFDESEENLYLKDFVSGSTEEVTANYQYNNSPASLAYVSADLIINNITKFDLIYDDSSSFCEESTVTAIITIDTGTSELTFNKLIRLRNSTDSFTN